MLARQRVSQRRTLETAVIPAPIGGMNTVDAGSMLGALKCTYAYNLIGGEFGLRSRLGFREWCTGLTGGDTTVRTMISLAGSLSAGSQNRLFACTPTGIWDVTDSSDAPTEVISFLSSAGKAGFGAWTVATNAAGARFILYTDEVNGYYVYTESTDTWAKIAMGGGGTEISGVDPATFVHVHIWKSRVWFTQKDTGTAWYTDVSAIYGVVTAFHFGSQMRYGGGLRGLWSWTYDGGAGIDDALVGVSDGGDVVIYVGTDPDDVTTFGLKGRWSVGSIPAGRRICIDSGGELLILTGVGVLSLSKLVAGGSVDDERLYETRDISNEFSQLVSQYGTLNGWALQVHPTDNALLILVPQADGSETIQLAMSIATRGWFRYRDLPILSAAVFEGGLHFGTADGRVCVNTGYVDEVLLSDPNTYTAVDWSLLTAFRDLGNGRRKQMKLIRPTIISLSTQPAVSVEARYNYDMTEPDAPALNPSAAGEGWDVGVWDTAVWGGAYNTSRNAWGASGMGVDVAVAIRGKAVSRTVLVKIDVGYIQGGEL